MAWLAPEARSSDGRSPVNNSMGICAMLASTTAGIRLATAVPEEVMIGAGRPVAFANPNAQNPRERSSMQGTIVARGWDAIANVSGDDLDPVSHKTITTRFRSGSHSHTICTPHTDLCDISHDHDATMMMMIKALEVV